MDFKGIWGKRPPLPNPITLYKEIPVTIIQEKRQLGKEKILLSIQSEITPFGFVSLRQRKLLESVVESYIIERYLLKELFWKIKGLLYRQSVFKSRSNGINRNPEKIRKTLKNLKSQYMHRNTELNTIYCVPVQYIGKGMKKESKKVKKDWKKVLTKGGQDGIIVKLSRETAITTEGNELTEKTF